MSQKTNAYKNYPPGSPEAVEKGCACAVGDNHRGKGIMGGTLKDSKGEAMYWISQDCPLHGEKKDGRSGDLAGC